jgi:hypothetical protein
MSFSHDETNAAVGQTCTDSASCNVLPATRCHKADDFDYLEQPASVTPPDTSRCREMTADENTAWFWTLSDDLSAEEELSWLLIRWNLDPVLFAFECFRTALTPYQAQILLDLCDAPAEPYAFYGLDPSFPKRQVLVPSGHGLGKTRVTAIAIWRHLVTRISSKVLCTAPTSDQLTGQLWGELRKLYRRMKKNWPDIAEQWEILSGSVVNNDPDYADWHALARTARADKPEGMQGAHALDVDDEFGDLSRLFGDETSDIPSGGMLIVMEEASGIDDIIRQTVEGALSEDGACLLAPCNLSNRELTYKLPYRDFAGQIHSIRVKGFVDPKYWEDVLSDCDGDEDHDRFKVRVRGMKPHSAFDQCIKSHWIDRYFERSEHEESKLEPAIISLDFGLTSDKHAMVIRQGFNVIDGEEWLPPDMPNEVTMVAADRAIDAQQATNAKYIIGDSNGVGNGAMEYLTRYYRDTKPELNVTVIHFNSGMQALDSRRYYRRRDQMWHQKGRKFFSSPYCNGPELPGFKKQLTVTGYHEDTSKKIKVETKDQVFKRTGDKSGNLADAFLKSLEVFTHESASDKKEKTPDHPAVFQKHFDKLKQKRDSGIYIR